MQKTTIPIIDIAPYTQGSQDTSDTAKLIREACKSVGFFYIKNHGVPQQLIQSFFKHSAEFFKLSKQQKREIRMELSGLAWRGFSQTGQEITNGILDHKEVIYCGKEHGPTDPKVLAKTPLHGENLYPKQVPALKEDIQSWLKEMDKLGGILIEAFAESLGLKPTLFTQKLCKDHYGLLNILHYPPIVNKQVQMLGQHCDYGFLTMLMGTQKGLQVKSVNNEWFDVEIIPGTFIVNIGDMLEKMTRGLYKSTPHRVIWTGRERYSIPYFYDPNWDQKIFDLQLDTTEEEKALMEKNRAYKRIDNRTIEKLDKTIGEYYVEKYVGSFPELAKLFNKTD